MTVRILRDIPFATKRIGWNEGRGPQRDMVLKLDAYLPQEASAQPRPALVMAFGGAFHIGSKEDDAGSDGIHTNTTTAEYCRRFAAEGLACFSVQYRLAQTDPEPGERILTEPDAVPMSRVNFRREQLGLPAIAPRAMAAIMEAAFDDVADAVGFVRENAAQFGVDPTRIVLGGFSAGARCAMYVAYGKRLPLKGVISLSGPLTPPDAVAYLERDKGQALPPLLMLSGTADLDYVCDFMPKLYEAFRQAGRSVEWDEVGARGHFYTAGDMTGGGRPVVTVMAAALSRWLLPGEPPLASAHVSTGSA